MTFPTPSTDTVDESRRAMKQVEQDEQERAAARLKLAGQGLLMVAPGQW